ncbi:MAG: sigma-70 family RNA polymerase sigma factor [Bryobacterales bacterium]|nr:sigma-70 family RNA polymerase sigma factor [Bryobacterales bacterium]
MTRTQASELVHALFSSWYPTLVRLVIRDAGSLEAAEDAVQETFIALYHALREGQQIENPKGWSLRVARRQISRSWREPENRLHHESLHILEYLPQGRAGQGEPSLENDAVATMLDLLSQRESEVLLLRLQALKYKEIAEQLGISPNTVNTLLLRALKKLQQAAKSEGMTKAVGHALDRYFSKAL